MLKVTFPHLGPLYIPLKSFLAELGVEPVVPPFTSQRTIALGTKISPEFACLPFKVNLGNYIEGIEAGAECIFMLGGTGPCRFGYYGELQQEILRENEYDVDFVILEAPQKQPRVLWERIKRYLPHHQPHHLYHAFRIFWEKGKAIDDFDRMVNKVRPLELNPGNCNRIQDNFYKTIDLSSSIGEIHTHYYQAVTELQETPMKPGKKIPSIMLLGEIYMVVEPRVNFQMERTLGAMGVEVQRSIYITDWIKEHFCLAYLKPGHHRQLYRLSEPYLQNFVGGHGLESVAHTVNAAVNHCHGAIHLAPFTCMPETIAMQTFPTIMKDLSISVLSIIIDEHSAEAGIQTRLEAFVDLLSYRNRQNKDLAVNNQFSL